MNLLLVDLLKGLTLLMLDSFAGGQVFSELVVIVYELYQLVLELLVVHAFHSLGHWHLTSFGCLGVDLQHLLIKFGNDLVSLEDHLLVDLQLLLCLIRHTERAVQVRIQPLLLPA